MDLYEYQGKQYFARFGIPTSPGGVADTVDEAVEQAEAAGYPVVVKAQVKVGGRGKAGGVKLAADADEVRLHAGNILGPRHQGPRRQAAVGRARVGHRQGVLRQLHPRPAGQAAPRHALGRGRRRDRGGGGDQSRRHRQDPHRPGHRAERGGRPRVGGPGQPRPRGAGAGGHAAGAALPLLRRGRLRPGRDQPAHPHPRGQGARARRQGDPRRERRLPPPRVGGVRRRLRRRPPGEDGQGEGPQLHRAVGHASASSPTAPGSPCRPWTSSPRSAARPPTSSTSGAAPTPTSWPPRSR